MYAPISSDDFKHFKTNIIYYLKTAPHVQPLSGLSCALVGTFELVLLVAAPVRKLSSYPNYTIIKVQQVPYCKYLILV